MKRSERRVSEDGGIRRRDLLAAAAAPGMRPESDPFSVAFLGPEEAATPYRALRDIRLAAAGADAKAVIVASPLAGRGADALAMLRAGRHVLIEPPIAASWKEFDQLMGEANERNLRIGTVYPLRFAPHAIRAREIVSRNQLGRVTAMRAAAVQNPADRQGYLGQVAALIDLVRWMLAAADDDVTARRDLDADPATPPAALHLLVAFGPASLACSTVPATDPDVPGDWSLTLTAQRGSLKLTGDGRLYLAAGATWARQSVAPGRVSPLQRLVTDFAEACRAGREPEVNAVDGMAGVGLLLGAVASARSGRLVPLVHPGYHWEADHAWVRSQRKGK